MKHEEIDIIVPVWNKPEQTRQCLAALVEHTPGARLIMLDNASERETESLLQEFAERLGDGSLLFRNDKIQDFVKVVNRGLARAEAPVVAIVRNTSTVGKGWLEPMLALISERPETGLAVPNLVDRRSGEGAGSSAPRINPIEISHACFDALLVRGDLYRGIGGFDEEMDGGLWCLKDYSRRAWQEGYVTVRCGGAPVFREENPVLGSRARREEKVRKSMERFVAAWGMEESFFFDMHGEKDPEELARQFGIFLESARCGNRITVSARPGIYREIVRKGFDRLHENIVVKRLPRLFASGAAEKMFSRMRGDVPELKMLTSADQLSGRLCRDEGGARPGLTHGGTDAG